MEEVPSLPICVIEKNGCHAVSVMKRYPASTMVTVFVCVDSDVNDPPVCEDCCL